jgi:hypothetical protein
MKRKAGKRAAGVESTKYGKHEIYERQQKKKISRKIWRC